MITNAGLLTDLAGDSDVFILESRIANLQVLDGTSRYNDDVWDLSPGLRQLHVKAPRIIWGSFPAAYRAAAKALTYAMISVELPGTHRPDLATVRTNHTYVKQLVEWMDARNIPQVAQLTENHLREYCEDNADKSYDAQSRAQRAVTRFWDYRDSIDDALTFNPRRLEFWGAGLGYQREGKTPRISEEVLTPLIEWALRFVDAGSQILDLSDEYDELRTSRPTYGRLYNKRQEQERMASAKLKLLTTVARLRSAGQALPGNVDGGLLRGETSLSAEVGGVNFSHLARMAGVPNYVAQHVARPEILAAAQELGIASGSFLSRRVTFDGVSVQIAYRDYAVLRNHLQTACYILVSFFTGMRDSEAKHLERGCSRARTDSTGALTRYEVSGLTFKGTQIKPAGRRATWVTTEVVHDAICLLERMIPEHSSHLFTPLREGTNADRGVARSVVTSAQTNLAIGRFIAAANHIQPALGVGQQIPVNRKREISTRMFRRTLAWFIAQKPGGIIAGALQYQHHSIQMFEGYAGESESGFLEEVEANKAMLRFEAFVLDRKAHGTLDLRGPAADEAERRIAASGEQLRFHGIVVEDDYQLADILEVADVNMHQSSMVICVMDPAKAACRRAATTPDWDGCQPMDCNNAVFTPDHLFRWRREERDLGQAIDGDVLAPAVIDRLRSRRDKIRKVLEKVGY